MALTYTQILKRIERTCGFKAGAITDNATRKEEFTDAINIAQDEVFSIIFNKINKNWQFDDNSHPDYPILKSDIVLGQRDYSFTEDTEGNLILDFYKVVMFDSNGDIHELDPVDQQNFNQSEFLSTEQGLPKEYDLTSNGIFLNPIPDFSRLNSLWVYVNREAMAFSTADTTRKPGFASLYHEYLVLRPSYEYARDNRLQNTEQLKRDLNEMRTEIETHYGNRGKDVRRAIRPNVENNR